QGFARVVGVQRSHRAVVAGVHGLQQVERLGSADFADDDAFGPHTQAVAHQFAHRHLAFAFDVGRAGFQPHHVRLLQLKFGGVFAGDDALVMLDELGQTVQQRGLPGAGTARYQHVAADPADDLQDLCAFRRDRPELDELVERQLVLLELTNGEGGAVDRQRRNDGVDAGAVGEAGVADRRGFDDAPADLADDALADVEQLLIVAEADAGLLDLAGDFDEHRAGAVDHDVGDVVARQQRLQRAVAEHVVADIVEQLFLLGDRHHDVLDRDDLVDDVADFLARGLAVELGELGKIDRLDQGAEDGGLDLIVIVGPPRLHGGRGRRFYGRNRRRNNGRRDHLARNRRRAGSRFRRLNGGLCYPRIAITTLTEHDGTPNRRLLLGPQLVEQRRQQRTLGLLGLATAGEPLR